MSSKKYWFRYRSQPSTQVKKITILFNNYIFFNNVLFFHITDLKIWMVWYCIIFYSKLYKFVFICYIKWGIALIKHIKIIVGITFEFNLIIIFNNYCEICFIKTYNI